MRRKCENRTFEQHNKFVLNVLENLLRERREII